MDAPLSDQPRNLVAWELELTAPDKKKGWAEFFFFFSPPRATKAWCAQSFATFFPLFLSHLLSYFVPSSSLPFPLCCDKELVETAQIHTREIFSH